MLWRLSLSSLSCSPSAPVPVRPNASAPVWPCRSGRRCKALSRCFSHRHRATFEIRPVRRLNQASATTPPRRAAGLAGTTHPRNAPALPVAAEVRHGIPSGLLQAIGVVESGRRDEATGARQPWPWTINAEGEPHLFDTKVQAVEWVRQAQAEACARSTRLRAGQPHAPSHRLRVPGGSVRSVGHADYAARFLKELRNTTAGGDWMTAAGSMTRRPGAGGTLSPAGPGCYDARHCADVAGGGPRIGIPFIPLRADWPRPGA